MFSHYKLQCCAGPCHVTASWQIVHVELWKYLGVLCLVWGSACVVNCGKYRRWEMFIFSWSHKNLIISAHISNVNVHQ